MTDVAAKGNTIVSGSEDNTVRVLDLTKSGEVATWQLRSTHTFRGHDDG